MKESPFYRSRQGLYKPSSEVLMQLTEISGAGHGKGENIGYENTKTGMTQNRV
jgi:hypothetical protein